jgi:hypothetical protein
VRMPERVTEKWGANPHHRKPKGSAARVIRGGVVGPKEEAQAVSDGQRVDSPVPLVNDEANRDWEGTRAARRAPFKLVARKGER